VLASGPGVVVFRGAVDPTVVDRATEAFLRLIDEQKRAGGATGDHFAAPGANDRVWGALDKLAVVDPEVFAAYYASDVLALVSEAWLGPGYQVTSQVNVVNPGGQAQVAHRDYHLGFMDLERAASFPAQVHAVSPALTLQGAVAHVDMPVETGPTLYLPHSQKYGAGYLAYHDPAFTAYFEEHHVQLPLAKGDAAFFNPAVFHGAGTNRTSDVRRMANLLQVSSAFGRAMETVDTTAICQAVHPVLCRWRAEGGRNRAIANVVAAAAEGYPFPTNLDLDQPVDSLVPQTEAKLLHRAVAEDWDTPRLVGELEARQARRRSQVGRR
jgi:ectoine hydroxylase-related dioxygenase (phytanoyl-CoA dioxygenase family)